jgi:hypothetical protein
MRYHTRSIVHHSFSVTGFVFNHPHGAIIRGHFAKPIRAFERTLEMDGAEIDGNPQLMLLNRALLR